MGLGKSKWHTSIIGILLLPDPLDGAIKGAEQAAPDAEVAAQHGSAGFYGGEGADAAFAEGAVAEAFYAVPEGAADGLRIEGG